MNSLSPDPAEVAARAQRTMAMKHSDQMAFHEQSFGKLGELQTKEQKSRLAEANSKLKNRRG